MKVISLSLSVALAVALIFGLLYTFELFPESFYEYTLAAEWGGFGYADEDGKFQLAYGSTIYEDEKGDEFLLITDCHNHNIQKFDLDGNFISKFGSEGKEPGFLKTPADITVDSKGKIYIAEENNDRISVFDNGGNFIETFTLAVDRNINGKKETYLFLEKPLGVALDSKNNLYIANWRNNIIIKNNLKDGSFKFLNKGGEKSNLTFQNLIEISSVGTGNAEFNYPYYIAVDSKDNVYVVDRANNRIQKFSPEGEFLLKWGRNGGDGSVGNGDGEFNFPHEIAIDKNDNIYVADTRNKRIQVFDPNGNFLFKLEKNFFAPKVVAVDNNLNIYVGDVGHRALKNENTPEHKHEYEDNSDENKITKWKKSLSLFR